MIIITSIIEIASALTLVEKKKKKILKTQGKGKSGNC